MLQNKKHFQHEFVTNLGSFEAYIDWRINNDLNLQKSFFYDKRGNCLVDFIGKYENLQNDFNFICDKLGITASLPHKNKSFNTKHFLDYYTNEGIEKIRVAYKDDIDTFGYDFSVKN